MRKKLNIAIIAFLISTTISCNGYYHFLVAPRPAPPNIVHPLRPSNAHIWIGGEWYWNGNSYHWRDGYWTIPHDRYKWNPGQWKQKNNKWFWKPGHWRK